MNELTSLGLIIQPVGLKVLEALQVDQRLLGLGAKLDALLGISVPSGRVALTVKYKNLHESKFGLGVHRAALFDALHDEVLRCADGIEFVPNTQIVSFQDSSSSSSKATVVDASGKAMSFDLVVDSLGSRSPLIECSERDIEKRRRKLPFGAFWANVRLPKDTNVFKQNVLEQRYEGASKMIGVLPIGKLKQNGDGDSLAAFFYSIKETDVKMFDFQRWKDDVYRIWPETAVLLEQVYLFRNVFCFLCSRSSFFQHFRLNRKMI